MTRTIILTILFTFFTSTFIKGQINSQWKPVLHAHWKLSSKKINDCEYDLIFTVTLDKGWHTYSVVKIKGAEQEVSSTEIIFKSNKDYTTVGSLTETKPTPEFDETIDKTVFLHYNKVVFTQRIKLNSGAKIKIGGTYEYQVCSSVCDRPPYENFEFELQGTATCKK